jgi:hypothetical protein
MRIFLLRHTDRIAEQVMVFASRSSAHHAVDGFNRAVDGSSIQQRARTLFRILREVRTAYELVRPNAVFQLAPFFGEEYAFMIPYAVSPYHHCRTQS